MVTHTIDSNAAVTQSASITATNLVLRGTGTKTLTTTSNDIDTIAVAGGEDSYLMNADDEALFSCYLYLLRREQIFEKARHVQ